jgi:hypothetical protein
MGKKKAKIEEGPWNKSQVGSNLKNTLLRGVALC